MPHAFLGASKGHWLNYDADKLKSVYNNELKKREGTELHELASNLIKKRIKTANLKKAFNMFVNDAIGFGMESEVILFYSNNAFGTADAISFKDGLLRIHDLKTGVHKVTHRQLDIYTAFFCLEYGVDPYKIKVEERIYQGRDILVNIPAPEDIDFIMNKIIDFDKILNELTSK